MTYSTRYAVTLVWLGVLWAQVDPTQAGTYQVGVAPPTVKVMIEGAKQGWPFEGWTADHYDLYLARGEHEAMQVVIMATSALTNARLAVSPPQNAHTAAPLAGQAHASLVGHVDVTDEPRSDLNVEYPAYLIGYHGWFPDPLLTFTNTCNINADDRVAFWIDVFAERAAAPGHYVSTITVTADDSPTTYLQLNIYVWDFQLPVIPSLPTAFSLSKVTSDGGGAQTLYGADYVTKGVEQQFWDMVLDHRLGMSHLYSAQAEPFGNVAYWAARGGNVFNLKKVNRGSVTDSDLAALVPQVTAAGLLSRSYVYAYDEATSLLFPKLCEAFNAVHALYPGLRTMSTALDPTFGTSPESSCLRSAVDIWVPLIDKYNQAQANILRSEGKDMWWYTCIVPSHPYPNFFIEYTAIEARLLMGVMTYKHQSGGFLYYNIANWPLAHMNVPITSGPYTNWDPVTMPANDGDGSLTCAGPDGPIPTIRMENIRDGVEDYDYLKLLADLVATLQAGNPTTPAQLAWLSSAQQLLAVPSSLVSSVVTYTRDPAALEGYRTQLAAAILTGQRLVAGLSRGDYDKDGDVDQDDVDGFETCGTGSQVVQADPTCWWADLDGDDDVDQDDFGILQRCYSDANHPADPACAG